MKININFDDSTHNAESIRAVVDEIYVKLGGNELRDMESFETVNFNLDFTDNPILPTKPQIRYYSKTGRLDIQVFVPLELFMDNDSEGRFLLVADKMLSTIRKVGSKSLERKTVYALFLKIKRKLNPDYDPEGELNDMTSFLVKECRNSIRIYINGISKGDVAKTRFGGLPDVPHNFEWPEYKDVKTGKVRPLSFIAQFNCKELATLDKDGLLPHTGVLSFFYELDTMKWGFDPDDAGSARVFWFEDVTRLKKADPPESLPTGHILPMMKIQTRACPSYPDYDDLEKHKLKDSSEQLYKKALKNLKVKERLESSKLLGWPEPLQDSMLLEAEYASDGFYLGDSEGWSKIPLEERIERKKTIGQEWQLLLQMDSIESEEPDFRLTFCDYGRIYFLIRKDDLAERRFDRVWLILQSL